MADLATTWAAAVPGDTDNAKDGADAIRDDKAAVAERCAMEHQFGAIVDKTLATCAGKHIAGGVAGMGLRTHAECIAGTQISLNPTDGQFITCSDNGGVWYWDQTHLLWIRTTPQVYVCTSTTATALTTLGTFYDILIDGASADYAIDLIDGEAVIIDVMLEFSATTNDGGAERDLRVYAYNQTNDAGGAIGLSGGLAAPQRLPMATSNIKGTFHGKFYDITPNATDAYIAETYRIKAAASGGFTGQQIVLSLVTFTVVRTSALA